MSNLAPDAANPTLGQYASSQPGSAGPLPTFHNQAAAPQAPVAPVTAAQPVSEGPQAVVPPVAQPAQTAQAAPVEPSAATPATGPDSTVVELQRQLAEMRAQHDAEARRQQYALPDDVASTYEPAELEAIKAVVREVLASEGSGILDLESAINTAVAKIAVPAAQPAQPAQSARQEQSVAQPALAPQPSLDAVELALRQSYGIGIQDLRQMPGYAQFANQVHNGQLVSEHLARMAYAGDTDNFLKWVAPVIQAARTAPPPPATVAPPMAETPGYVPNPAGAVAPPADPNTMVFDTAKVQPLLDKAAAHGMSALTDQERQVLDSFETATYEGRVT